MALFKPFRGSHASLDALEKHDGYAYFCTDDGSFHIDYVDDNGDLQRKQINDDFIKQLSNNYEKYNLPILKITGDEASLNKESYTTMNYVYGDMSGVCEMKWQGNSSLAYPKKNYTIKFDHKFVAFDNRKYYKGEFSNEMTEDEFEATLNTLNATEGQRLLLNSGISVKLSDGVYYTITGTKWSKQKKYCTKANYIEHSHARNIVGARLWGEVVRSRFTYSSDTTNITPSLRVAAAPMAGAVDGFPIIITMNDEFLGLYTFNIPKDGWMMNMEEVEGTRQAIVCADYPESEACAFMDLATCVPDENGRIDFEIEFTSDETNFGTEQVRDSLNGLIGAVCDCVTRDADISIIDQYLDWESAIDYYIYNCLIGGMDGMRKNYILATYDGVKWFFSAYDLDSTYGLYWDGTKPLDANTTTADIDEFARKHKLMGLIKKYKWHAFVKRYNELRKGALSLSNIQYKFGHFIADIPKAILHEDAVKWTTLPNTEVNNYSQIISWYENRCKYIDEQVNGIRFDFPKVQDYIQGEDAYEFLDNLVINNEDWYKDYSIGHFGGYVSATYNPNNKIILKVNTNNIVNNQNNPYILKDLNSGDAWKYGKELSRTSSKINVYAPLTNPEEKKNVLICGDRILSEVLVNEIENKFTSNGLTNYHLLKNIEHNNFSLVETAETTNGEVKYSCSNNVITVSNVDITTPLTGRVQLTIKFTEAITSNCIVNVVVENANDFTGNQSIPFKLVQTKSPWYETSLPTLYPYFPDTSFSTTSVELGENTVDGFRFNCNAGCTFDNLRITVTVSNVSEGTQNYLGGTYYDWYTFVDSPDTLPSKANNNPFWNNTANTLDFKGYVDTALTASGSPNGTLDYVICVLGKEIYHTAHKTEGDIDKNIYQTRVDAIKFIKMVQAAYPECKILLSNYVLPPNFYTNKELFYHIHGINTVYQELASTYSNVRVCNVTSQVSSELSSSYMTETKTIGGVDYTLPFNTSLLSENGYKEMAKSIWRGFTGLVNMN